MRLPDLRELQTEEARNLHAHDAAEYHCPRPGSDYSRMYCGRLESVVRKVRETLPSGRVLDLGCAQGNFGLLLAEAGYHVVAVDLRPAFLAYARMKHERGAFAAVAASGDRLPFAGAEFDAVIWGEVIEHVAFPEHFLSEIARVLRPGGHLLLTTPNGGRLHTGLPTFAGAGDRNLLAGRQFQPDSDGHLFLFSREELQDLLSGNGFSVLKHEFSASPWLTGRLGFRYFARWVPLRWRFLMDAWTLRHPRLAAPLAESHIVLAQRRQEEVR
ncbi:MAG TPA: methyltransferase domain-containing protein [Candidatus Acidoferrales bacterium]|nr:methyltransferase domain-containing protein [Candidatus Acidoferrales bacterium]